MRGRSGLWAGRLVVGRITLILVCNACAKKYRLVAGTAFIKVY